MPRAELMQFPFPTKMCQTLLLPRRSATWAKTPAPCSGHRLPMMVGSRSWVSAGAQGQPRAAAP